MGNDERHSTLRLGWLESLRRRGAMRLDVRIAMYQHKTAECTEQVGLSFNKCAQGDIYISYRTEGFGNFCRAGVRSIEKLERINSSRIPTVSSR